MDPIEQAIRNAFTKGDPEDRAFREKVYRSASAALEKALQANASITPEAAARRRKSLLAVVTSVESEFVPAVEPAAPSVSPPVAAPSAPMQEPAAPDIPAPAAARREEPSFFPESPRVEPPVSRDPAPDWPTAPAPQRAERPALAGEPRRPSAEPAARSEEKPKRGRSRWGSIAGLLSFLIIVGLAVWIAAEVGLFAPRDSGQPQGSGPAASDSGSGTDGAPRRPGEDEALENWIVVFSPDDPTTVAAAAGAKAEVVDAGGDKAIRIASGQSGAVVRFDIGQGTLERITGKHAVFDIVARTGDGPETQMSVSCDFGALGECGRNRYIVGSQRSEFLLQVDVPAGTPAGAGAIEIQSDVEDGGKAVEILQIRVSATAP
ncbi:hypothetical protein [Mesorhizobium sp. J428]|uniref:hypothetical protein n=1 Tax=Mesorhizobium sp. J428 TaxID=2898440 RepID=UPI002151FCD1|nr:hypothetical protein [Mesorhizobium sp. J428]MCR5858318.1 hypothetical protein [Mesorhizobium sp. J428]